MGTSVACGYQARSRDYLRTGKHGRKLLSGPKRSTHGEAVLRVGSFRSDEVMNELGSDPHGTTLSAT